MKLGGKKAFMSDMTFWQILIRVSFKFYTYQDCLDIYILLIQTCRTFVKVEINKVLREQVKRTAI